MRIISDVLEKVYGGISDALETTYGALGGAFGAVDSLSGDYFMKEESEFAATQKISKDIYNLALENATADGLDEVNYGYLSAAKTEMQRTESAYKKNGVYTADYLALKDTDVFAISNGVKAGLYRQVSEAPEAKAPVAGAPMAQLSDADKIKAFDRATQHAQSEAATA